MTETAVGLFEDRGRAEEVAQVLLANGFPLDGIRILSKHSALPVQSVNSTPAFDYAAALFRDLKAMGASEAECEAFVEGLHRGNGIVFASGTLAEADNAVTVMKSHHSIDTEEFEGSAGALPGMHISEMAAHDIGAKISVSRKRSEGPRVFSW
jgi:hypothetical protein